MPSDRYFDMDVPDSLSVANIVCALVVSTTNVRGGTQVPFDGEKTPVHHLIFLTKPHLWRPVISTLKKRHGPNLLCKGCIFSKTIS